MSDIVERLRERTALRYMGDCKCGQCRLVPRPMVDEAADEIERLTEGRDTMGNLWAKVNAENVQLRAEVERLRAAAVWHCEACGTVTRSGDCDCTKLGTGTQRLVPFDYRACLDAEIERLRALVRSA